MVHRLGFPVRQRIIPSTPYQPQGIRVPISSISDSFDGSVIDTIKWSIQGSPTVSGGILSIPTVDTYAGVESNARFTLINNAVYSEFIRMSNAPASAETSFMLNTADGLTQLMFFNEGGTVLNMRSKIAGVNSDTSITYDAVAHRYLQIRESSGTAYFETSPDAVIWTTRRSIDSSSMPLTQMTVRVESGYWDVGSATDAAQVGGINMVGIIPFEGWGVPI